MKQFFMPTLSLMGQGCLSASVEQIKAKGFKKALIVCDKVLVEVKLVDRLTELLEKNNLEYVIFDEAQPNPTSTNVMDGVNLLKQSNCDYVISFGGGSPHDCAKGIALVAANGGHINDYARGHLCWSLQVRSSCVVPTMDAMFCTRVLKSPQITARCDTGTAASTSSM